MAALDLDDIYERYENVWREGMNRWWNGINQIRAGTYEPSQLFKDAAYFWVEGVLGPWVPKPPVVPIVRVDLSRKAGPSEAFGSRSVRPKDNSPLVCSDLVASAGHPIPAKDVTAAFTQNNSVVVVRITYDPANIGPVDTTYRGPITQNKQELVYIHAVVTP
jgi:hypothetical protein